MPLSIKHPNRRKIYAFIRLAPGTHARDLQRELEMPMSTLEYHLRKLQEMNKVTSRSHGAYKSYYPKDKIGRVDKTYLYYLHQVTPRRIATAVAEKADEGVFAQELAELLDVAPSTVSHHANNLIEGGLITKTRRGARVVYRATDPERIERLLREYPGSYLETFGQWFRKVWADDNPGEAVGSTATSSSQASSAGG